MTIVQKEVQRSATYFEGIEASRPLELNPEQRQARDAVVSAIGSHQPPLTPSRDYRKWEDGGLLAD